MKRRTLAIVIALASLIAACDRMIDLSRTGGPDAGGGPDTGTGLDAGGGLDGIADDGGNGAGTDAAVD